MLANNPITLYGGDLMAQRIFIILSVLLAVYTLGAQFTVTQSIDSVHPRFLAWGDWNSDSYLDLLAACYIQDSTAVMKLYTSNAGIFSDEITLPGSFTEINSIKWLDMDRDNDLDILFLAKRDGIYSLFVYKNIAGVFTEGSIQISSPLGFDFTRYACLELGDYNCDGAADLLVTNTSEQGAVLLRRTDDFSFTDAGYRFRQGFNVSSGQFVDYDLDGDLDIFLGNDFPYVRNDNGVFHAQDTPLYDYYFNGAKFLLDLNADGDLDLLSNSFRWYQEYWSGYEYYRASTTFRRWTGTGWEAQWKWFDAEYSTLNYPSIRAWADFNNDGYADLLSEYTDIYPNPDPYGDPGNSLHLMSYGTPNAGVLFMADLQPNNFDAAAGDFNNDGKLDFAAIRHNSILIYRNDSEVINTAPSSPTNLRLTRDGTSVVVAWDASTDDLTPQPALRYNLRFGANLDGNEIITSNSLGSGFLLYPHYGNHSTQTYIRLRDLVPGLTYHFAVQAIDNGLRGSAFTRFNFVAPTLEVPAEVIYDAPMQDDFVASASVTLRWTPDLEQGGQPESYRVYLGTNNPPTNVLNGTDSSGLCQIDITVNAGTTYYWQVEPYNSSGNQLCSIQRFYVGRFLAEQQNSLSNVLIQEIMMNVQNGERLFMLEGDGDFIYKYQDGEFNSLAPFPPDPSDPEFAYRIKQDMSWIDFNNDGWSDAIRSFYEEDSYPDGFGSSFGYTNAFQRVPSGGFVVVEAETLFPGLLDAEAQYSNTLLPFAIADVNTDGVDDIALIHNTIYYDNWDYDLTAKLMLNQNGVFEDSGVVLPDSDVGNMAFMDFDNDCDADLLCQRDWISNSRLSLWENQAGSYVVSTTIDSNTTSMFNFQIIDFDGDGWLDIFIGRPPQSLWQILKNNQGEFELQTLNIPLTGYGISNSNFDWGDYDNDGDADFLFVQGSFVRILRNDAGVLNLLDLRYPIGANPLCRWLDIDGDGLLDILVSSSSTATRTMIYRQHPLGSTSSEDTSLVPPVNTLSVYPNPAAQEVNFDLSKLAVAPEKLAIYNLKGQLVRSFQPERGAVKVVWDGKEDSGRPVANGIYFYRSGTGKSSVTGKFTLLRRH